EKTGVIDVRMNPRDPDTLLVATYERQRDGYDGNDPAKKWGPGSGLYRTTDGGKSFHRVTEGLPNCTLGRIGLDFYRKEANAGYAIVESEKIGMGPPRPVVAYMGLFGEDSEDGGARVARVFPGGPADKAGLKEDDVIVRLEGKAITSYSELQEEGRGRKAGDKVKLEVMRAGQRLDAEMTYGTQPTGGGFAGRGGRGGQPGGEPGKPGGGDEPGKPGQPGGFGGRQGFDPKRPYSAALGGQEENVQSMQGPEGPQT